LEIPVAKPNEILVRNRPTGFYFAETWIRGSEYPFPMPGLRPLVIYEPAKT